LANFSPSKEHDRRGVLDPFTRAHETALDG
jgi:hypothetical protein